MSGQEWITTAVLLICAGTDLCSKKVYRWVVMLYMTMAVAGRLAAGMAGGMSVFVADLLPGAICLLMARATHQGIGYGDAMLILVCGLSVGWSTCIELVLSAFFLVGGSGACVADPAQRAENRASICTVSIGSMDVAADMWSIKLRICII